MNAAFLIQNSQDQGEQAVSYLFAMELMPPTNGLTN